MMWDVQKLLGQLPQPVVTILRQATPTLLEQMTDPSAVGSATGGYSRGADTIPF